MADDFIMVNGTKVEKKLFPDEESWNKLVQAQQKQQTNQTTGNQVAEAWAQKAKEEQEFETVTGIGGKEVRRRKMMPAQEEKPQQTEASVQQIKTSLEEAELAKTKAELAALQAEKAAGSVGQPSVQMGQTADQAAVEGEQAGPTINIQTAPTGGVGPGMTKETVINQVMQSPEAKEAVKLYQDATQASIAANTQQIDFDVARANQLATMKEAAVKETDSLMADMRARDQKIAEEMDVQRSKMQTTAEQLANYKFQDFFQGRDGARIMAGISVALGAIGSALTKGPNYAMQIIDGAIQNDLALQKANYEKLKGTYEADQTLYGQLKARRLDDLQATQILIKTRYDQAALQMEAAAAKVSDEEAKNKANILAAQLRQEGAKAMMAATEGLKTTVQTQIKAAPGMAPGDIIEARAKFEDRVKKSQVGEAINAEMALQKFRDIVKAGASEAALIDFVASRGGLQQGSVAMEFVNMLNKEGLVDFSIEKVRKWIQGGSAPALIKKVENFMDAASKRATTAAVKHLPAIVQEARLVGLDPEAYLGQLNRATLQGVMIQRQGARRATP